MMDTKTLPEPTLAVNENTLLTEVSEPQVRRLQRLENSNWKGRFKKALAVKLVQLAIPASNLFTELVKSGAESGNDVNYFRTAPRPQQTISQGPPKYG